MIKDLPGLAVRAGEFVPPAADVRTVEISFSSEAPYLRASSEGTQFLEVLGHNPEEVDLSALNSGAAPLLKDHKPVLDAQIGVIERVWLAAGRGYASVRFASTPAAEDVLARVREGVISCVSVGYRIMQAKRDGDENGVPVVRVTRWLPREISFVAIPADSTVGVGRADGDDAGRVAITPLENTDAERLNIMLDEKNPAAPKPEIDLDKIRADATKEAMTRSAEMDAIAAQFGLPAKALDAAKRSGQSLDAFRETVMDYMASEEAEATRSRETKIGLSEKEVASFSIFNAVRYLMNPNTATEKRAGLEIEASRAAAQKFGKEPGGLFIPDDILGDGNFGRSQNTLTAGAGGALVPTTYMSGSFIDLLRNRMALTGLGVRVMQGLRGEIAIPKRTGSSTMYFLDEEEDVASSDGSFSLIPMTGHGAAVATALSRKMMINGSPDAEALTRDDLLTSLALGVDKATLVGGYGIKAPLSVRDQIVGTKANFATAGQPTFAEMVGLETSVAVANADIGNMAYIYGAAISGHLKTTPKFSGGEIPIEGDNGMVNGYGRVRTNQVATGEVFFGDWSNVIVGMWSGFDLRVDTATNAANDGKVLRVFVDMDVAVRHVEAFKMGS